MKESEANDILALLKGAFPTHKMEQSDREVWVESLKALDAELAFQAVMRGRLEWKFMPAWSVFKEGYRMQERLREPVGEQRAQLPKATTKMPLWIRRWAAARYLYKRFGRDQDMRRFPEQGEYRNPLDEVMPEDEWVAEAERIMDKDVWGALRS